MESGASSLHVCSSGISAERYKVFWIHSTIRWIALHVLESDGKNKRGITVLCWAKGCVMWGSHWILAPALEPRIVLPMDKYIAVGFGAAYVTSDGETVW